MIKKTFLFMWLILISIMGAFPNSSHRVTLGWMNLTPCLKIAWIKNSLGFPSPTIKTSEQRLYAYAYIRIGNVEQRIKNTLKDCALEAVAACGQSSLIASPALCLPAFQSTMLSCLERKGIKLLKGFNTIKSRIKVHVVTGRERVASRHYTLDTFCQMLRCGLLPLEGIS